MMAKRGRGRPRLPGGPKRKSAYNLGPSKWGWDFNLDDVTAGIDTMLERISYDVARAGAQAMAQIVYDNARMLVPVSERAHTFKSRYEYEPGSLKRSIYQVYSKDNSGYSGQEYHISWSRKADGGVAYGFMVEFGTSRSPAQPFLYPAYEMGISRMLPAAMEAMKKTFASGGYV